MRIGPKLHAESCSSYDPNGPAEQQAGPAHHVGHAAWCIDEVSMEVSTARRHVRILLADRASHAWQRHLESS